jgi:hypothetical protein
MSNYFGNDQGSNSDYQITPDIDISGLPNVQNFQNGDGNSDSNSTQLAHNLISSSLDFKGWVAEINDLKDKDVKLSKSIDSLLQMPNNGNFNLPKPLRKLFRKTIRVIKKEDFIRIVLVAQAAYGTEIFFGGHVDYPQKGDETTDSIIYFSGWVMGKKSQPQSVRLVVNEDILNEGEINLLRPDVSKIYCHLSDSHEWGYRLPLDIRHLPEEGCIEVQAVFSEGKTGSIGFAKFCKY